MGSRKHVKGSEWALSGMGSGSAQEPQGLSWPRAWKPTLGQPSSRPQVSPSAATSPHCWHVPKARVLKAQSPRGAAVRWWAFKSRGLMGGLGGPQRGL